MFFSLYSSSCSYACYAAYSFFSIHFCSASSTFRASSSFYHFLLYFYCSQSFYLWGFVCSNSCFLASWALWIFYLILWSSVFHFSSFLFIQSEYDFIWFSLSYCPWFFSSPQGPYIHLGGKVSKPFSAALKISSSTSATSYAWPLYGPGNFATSSLSSVGIHGALSFIVLILS